MIINFNLLGNGGSGEGVSIETFNKFVQDQATIDESQNEAIEEISKEIADDYAETGVDTNNLSYLIMHSPVNGNTSTKMGGQAVFGYSNEADGYGSFVAGNYNKATGPRSVAFGRNNIASKSFSMATGYYASATGDYAIAQGVGLKINVYLTGDAGTYSLDFKTPNMAEGWEAGISVGAMIFKGSTMTTITESSKNEDGTYSIKTKESLGACNDTQCSLGSAAASGKASYARGLSFAKGDYSTAIGYMNTVAGKSAISMGERVDTNGIASASIGYNNNSKGDYNYAIGTRLNLLGKQNASIGITNNITGESNTAHGFVHEITGNQNATLGYQNTIIGNQSYSFGLKNYINGTASVASGFELKVNGSREYACGIFNVSNSDTVVSVGIGSDDAHRKNGLEIKSDGTVLGQDGKEIAYKEDVEELKLFKFPNVTIFGEPTINNGQISGFTDNDYVQFPFLVDFRNQAFEINMCFTTGNNVTSQENIFDSLDGLAFAVRDGKFVVAMSSTGTSWDMGEHTGITDITPNTTYYVKFSWNKLQYKLEVSTDNKTYNTDFVYVDSHSLFAKQIIIGKSVNGVNHFSGSINLNNCSLSIMGQTVWQGMDDAGIATRLATDMSNIDEAGVNYINGLIDAKLGPIDTLLSNILGE